MPSLVLVVALGCEADPVVDALGLSRVVDARGFSLYRRVTDGHAIELIVSGVGKVRAAAACGFLLGRGVGPEAIWVNFGIGGQREAPLGQLVCAETIEDEATGRCYQLSPPPGAAGAALRALRVLTLDRPTAVYPEQAVVEMEASGIAGALSAARHRSTLYCLKLISDNAANPPPARPNPKAVKELVGWRVDALKELLRSLSQEPR